MSSTRDDTIGSNGARAHSVMSGSHSNATHHDIDESRPQTAATNAGDDDDYPLVTPAPPPPAPPPPQPAPAQLENVGADDVRTKMTAFVRRRNSIPDDQPVNANTNGKEAEGAAAGKKPEEEAAADPNATAAAVALPNDGPLIDLDDESLREFCLSVLKKHPQSRAKYEIRTLASWVPSLKCTLLVELEAQVLAQLCAKMTYEVMEERTTVFRQGDESDKLYIILHGSVSLWVDKEAESRSKAAAAANAAATAPGTAAAGANGGNRRTAPGFKTPSEKKTPGDTPSKRQSGTGFGPVIPSAALSTTSPRGSLTLSGAPLVPSNAAMYSFPPVAGTPGSATNNATPGGGGAITPAAIGGTPGSANIKRGRRRNGAGSSFSSRHFPTYSIGSASYFSAPIDQQQAASSRHGSLQHGVTITGVTGATTPAAATTATDSKDIANANTPTASSTLLPVSRPGSSAGRTLAVANTPAGGNNVTFSDGGGHHASGTSTPNGQPTNTTVPTASPASAVRSESPYNHSSYILTIRAGSPQSVFGELGLVTNTTRTGTIRTEERSEFLCISKVDFDLVLRDYSDGLMNKIAAMRTFDAFKSMSDKHLQRLSMYFQMQSFPPKKPIIEEGSDHPICYFIVNGECQVTHTPKKGGMTSSVSTSALLSPPGSITTATQPLAGNVQPIILATLGPGEMFGEVALLQPEKKANDDDDDDDDDDDTPVIVYPQYGVRTRTAADILVVRSEDFIRRVRKDLLASIRHRSRLKLEWRKERANQLVKQNFEVGKYSTSPVHNVMRKMVSLPNIAARSTSESATPLTVEMQEAGVKRRHWATKRKRIEAERLAAIQAREAEIAAEARAAANEFMSEKAWRKKREIVLFQQKERIINQDADGQAAPITEAGRLLQAIVQHAPDVQAAPIPSSPSPYYTAITSASTSSPQPAPRTLSSSPPPPVARGVSALTFPNGSPTQTAHGHVKNGSSSAPVSMVRNTVAQPRQYSHTHFSNLPNFALNKLAAHTTAPQPHRPLASAAAAVAANPPTVHVSSAPPSLAIINGENDTHTTPLYPSSSAQNVPGTTRRREKRGHLRGESVSPFIATTMNSNNTATSASPYHRSNIASLISGRMSEFGDYKEEKTLAPTAAIERLSASRRHAQSPQRMAAAQSIVSTVTAATAAHSMQLASSAALAAAAHSIIDDAVYRSEAGRAPPRASPTHGGGSGGSPFSGNNPNGHSMAIGVRKPFSWFGPPRPSSPLGIQLQQARAVAAARPAQRKLDRR